MRGLCAPSEDATENGEDDRADNRREYDGFRFVVLRHDRVRKHEEQREERDESE